MGVDSGETATGTTSVHDESRREGKLRLLGPLRRRENNNVLKENTQTHPAQEERNPQIAVTQGNDMGGEIDSPEETPTTDATPQYLP